MQRFIMLKSIVLSDRLREWMNESMMMMNSMNVPYRLQHEDGYRVSSKLSEGDVHHLASTSSS